MFTHPVVVSDLLDNQRCDDPVSQLDTPCHINNLIPVLSIVSVYHPNDHQEIQVRLAMEVASSFRAEENDPSKVVPVARS